MSRLRRLDPFVEKTIDGSDPGALWEPCLAAVSHPALLLALAGQESDDRRADFLANLAGN